MNPILTQVGTIFIPVSNIEKSRDWYCDLLGLHPTVRFCLVTCTSFR